MLCKNLQILYKSVRLNNDMFSHCENDLTSHICSTLYIVYTAIGYGAKSVKGWVLGCPDIPTVNLIGYNAKNRL